MATNELYYPGDTLPLAVPVGTKSGDPVVVGEFAGVALEDRNTAGVAPVRLKGVFDLPVEAVDNSGDAGADADKAVAVGDKIYFASGDDPHLSKRADGSYFGVAYGAITAGETATIPVTLKGGV